MPQGSSAVRPTNGLYLYLFTKTHGITGQKAIISTILFNDNDDDNSNNNNNTISLEDCDSRTT